MRTIFIVLLLNFTLKTYAQELLRFQIPGDGSFANNPVSLSLNNIDYNTDDGELILFELVKGQELPIHCQIETGLLARLWFVLPENTSKSKKREFVVKKGNGIHTEKKVELYKDHNELKLVFEGNPILAYRHSTTYPPTGVSTLYKRSGYIHPLYSPEGQILTNIQPDDHYHHYGIWGPWTKTHINGREVDFWNLIKGEGTVKFAGFLSETEGDVFSGFKAYQQHIDFGAKGEDQVAINEVLEVRAWNIGKKKWLVDYTVTLNCPLDSGIMLDAYRYGGGIGYRATEKWHKNNCTVLTSEGKTRAEADGTDARWCIVEGESSTKSGRSGILFMSYPANRMHPEPMRIWPLNANGDRGDMYFEFCPIRHNDWKIEKGKDYTLRYRMLIFDGEITSLEAENYWRVFANTPEITIDKCMIMKKLFLLSIVSFFLIESGAQNKVTAEKVGDKIEIRINGALFTNYILSEFEKYPFFFPVNGPSKASVTSMRNANYPHHSSLFFGCDKVNGGNYWQEGLERGQIVSLRADILESGGDKVILENENIWKRPGAMSPIKDVRTITVTAPSANMYQLDFDITMEMLMDVTIERTNHSLFSGRMDPDLAVINGGTMVNAEGESGEKATFGKRSAWMDYYGRRGDMIEGMAILQHPSNAWFPVPWFTRDYGFFSPTPMYWPEDLDKGMSLKKGEKIKLRYRVLVHQGDYKTSEIAKKFEQYSKE